jgi:glycogen(starch) synthase
VVTPQRAPHQPPVAQYQGIPIYRFPFERVLYQKDIDHLLQIQQQVAALKRTFAPDLIHINSVTVDSFFHLTTAQAHPAPLLVSLHGAWASRADGRNSVVERMLPAADWVAACSAATLDQARQLVPEITPRSSVMYNGLELPSLPPDPLPVDAPRVLCLGRLARGKRVDGALTAFASIAGRFPQARLVIAGDGLTRAELEQQAARQRISEAVDFIGWVAPRAVPALLNTATLVILPSQTEGLPLVALEAALMARPVVATRVGGVPEAVVQGQTGLLIEPDDDQALAEAMAWLLDHPEPARQMGQAARRRAQQVFGWERYVEAHDALYQHLVAKWRRRVSALR